MGHVFGDGVVESKPHFHAAQCLQIYEDDEALMARHKDAIYFQDSIRVVDKNGDVRKVIGVVVDKRDNRLRKCHQHYFYENKKEEEDEDSVIKNNDTKGVKTKEILQEVVMS